MDIFQVFHDRRSIRKYLDTPVEPEKIELLLDAAFQYLTTSESSE